MSDKPDGEPACPIWTMSGGMSLRDYFAGQVLPAIYKHAMVIGTQDLIVAEAYDVADSMLQERAKGARISSLQDAQNTAMQKANKF